MDQSTRDKKIADLVAHKSPDELARMVVESQAAQDEQRDKQDRERSAQQESQQLPAGKSQSNQTPLKPGQPVTATDAEEAEPVDGALDKAEHAKRKGSHK